MAARNTGVLLGLFFSIILFAIMLYSIIVLNISALVWPGVFAWAFIATMYEITLPPKRQRE